MNSPRSAVFLVHLLQDVNILRPLIFMAARDFEFDTMLLVSTKFTARDSLGMWRSELERICAESGARLVYFDDAWEAHAHLTGRGLLFSASESHLDNHKVTHEIFRVAPPGYVKVTLQHGLECIGFRHSTDHVRAHGATASFGADIVCGWSDADHLPSLTRSQRAKLLVTGPTSVLQMASGPVDRLAGAPGIVCENLHSVRFMGAADCKVEFIDTFAKFSRYMARRKREVRLRAHPGGQYFLRNSVPLPRNVRIENAPLYRLDLRRFSYGISAPSSVLFDMVLAGIPTAVWLPRHGDMDADSYEGLTLVSSARDWEAFARAAERDPSPFLERQRQFLESTRIQLDPRVAYRCFARLFEAARRAEVRAPGSAAEMERILFVAPDSESKVQAYFERSLAPLIARGEIVTGSLTRSAPEAPRSDEETARQPARMLGKLNAFNPSVILLCGNGGPSLGSILEWARSQQVPVIYFTGDELFDRSCGADGVEGQLPCGHLERDAIEHVLTSATLVYAASEQIKARLLREFPRTASGRTIRCCGSAVRQPSPDPAKTIGFVAGPRGGGSLAVAFEALDRLLEQNPGVRFETIGLQSLPQQLLRFGERVTAHPAGLHWRQALAERCWDIAICPVGSREALDGNTKWIAYTGMGAAVVASRHPLYEDYCAGGCGILADTAGDWFAALDLLANSAEERVATVVRAQSKLERQYHAQHQREQLLDIIDQGHAMIGARSKSIKKEVRVC